MFFLLKRHINDFYYMLGVFTNANQYKFVQDKSKNNTTYSIAINNSSILNYINESVNIDSLNKTNQQINTIGILFKCNC